MCNITKKVNLDEKIDFYPCDNTICNSFNATQLDNTVGRSNYFIWNKYDEIPVDILEQAKNSVSKEVNCDEIDFTAQKIVQGDGWPQNLNALGKRYFVKFGFDKQVDKLLEETIELSHAIKQCQKYGDVNTSRFRNVLAECFDVLFLIEHQIFRFTDPELLNNIYAEKIEQLKKGLKNG